MFDRYRMWYRHALVWMKACGGNLVDKPQPMQEEDIKACAELALFGSVTMMYARVAVFLKSLHGCRNPVFTAWQWKHIQFVPAVLYKDGAQRRGVMASAVLWVRLTFHSVDAFFVGHDDNITRYMLGCMHGVVRMLLVVARRGDGDPPIAACVCKCALA